MKRVVLLFVLMSFISSTLSARRDRSEALSLAATLPTNEISISAGFVTVPGIAYTTGGILGSILSGGAVSMTDVRSYSAIGLEYQHYLRPFLAVGGCMAIEPLSMTMTQNSSSTPTEQKVNSIFVSIMPSLKLPWFRKAHWSMYSNFYAGLWFDAASNEELQNLGFAFQVNPIGVDFGGTQFRGFAELGLGMKGILCLGLRYCF